MKNITNTDYQKLVKENKTVFDENNCPMTAAMKVIGGKWKLILINFIYISSPARFGELKRKTKGISQTMLTAMLRELEEDGIIQRKIYAEIPPKVEYSLTELGLSLKPLVALLCQWGHTYVISKTTHGPEAK